MARRAKKPFTKRDLSDFDCLTLQLSSLVQIERIIARIALNRFIKEHGKTKCDLMYEVLKKQDRGR